MKKKIIFFDGDGTLWYPTSTKRTKKPHWIYHDPLTKDNYLEHLTLAPGTKEALEAFKGKGVYLVVVSANPYAEELAVKETKERLGYFGINKLFYSCRASAGDDPNGKVAIILDTIKELNLTKEDALMVGDSYFYDYLAPRQAGIDAFFIENEVSKMPDEIPTDIQKVKEVSDLLDILK
jgi:phosphoglycolate phosphatase-like HAD superfamily hydrolase